MSAEIKRKIFRRTLDKAGRDLRDFLHSRRLITDFPERIGLLPPTLTFDLSASTLFTVPLIQDVTAIEVLKPTVGIVWQVLFLQDAIGGHTVSGWPSDVRFEGGTFTPTATANRYSLIQFLFVSENHFQLSVALDVH